MACLRLLLLDLGEHLGRRVDLLLLVQQLLGDLGQLLAPNLAGLVLAPQRGLRRQEVALHLLAGGRLRLPGLLGRRGGLLLLRGGRLRGHVGRGHVVDAAVLGLAVVAGAREEDLLDGVLLERGRVGHQLGLVGEEQARRVLALRVGLERGAGLGAAQAQLAPVLVLGLALGLGAGGLLAERLRLEVGAAREAGEALVLEVAEEGAVVLGVLVAHALLGAVVVVAHMSTGLC